MTEIIVYRNPAEAALWNIFQSGDLFPFFVGFFVFFIVLLPLDSLLKKKFGYIGNKSKYASYGSIAASAIAAIGVVVWMI